MSFPPFCHLEPCSAGIAWRGSKSNWEDGITWRGEHAKGRPNGHGVLVFPAADSWRWYAVGTMADGYMQAWWAFRYRDSTWSTFHYKDDEVHGLTEVAAPPLAPPPSPVK